MIPFLMAAALSCSDAKEINQSIMKQRDISTLDKHELIEVMRANTEEGCDWDAND